MTMLTQLQFISKSTMRIIILMIITIIGICKTTQGQTLIGHQDFDGTVTLGAVIGGVNGTIVTGSSAAADRPASSTFYSSVNTAASVTNGSGTVTTSNVSGLGSYVSKYFEFRLASWSIGGSGNGADGADIVTVAISTDGGTTYSNELTVAGNANAYWHYSTGTGLASVTYDGDNVPAAFAPAGGTNRTTDGYSTVRINLPDAGAQARLRITLLNNNAAERWTVDDIKIFGTAGCTSPTTQASSFSATSITSTGMTLNWTSGNGDGRIVVVKAGSAVNTDPTSGTTYTPNTIFGSGSQLGTGNYVVYDGTGSSVAITGLSANTTYHVAVYEYSTTGQCYNLVELIGNATTLCDDPSTQASAVNFTSVTSTTATINFTGGNGTNALVVVKSGSAVGGSPTDGTTYTANTTFASGGTIAALEYVVYANTGTSVSITGLTANTTYYVSVFEYNSASNCYQTTSPATGNFTTNSSTSDIITANGEAATISSIINTAGPLTSAQGTQVWQFTIRDGGASSPDADALSTIVTGLQFTQAAGNQVTNWANAIQAIDLFDGATNVGSGVVATGPNTVTFTGLNINVADNGTKTISVRLTLKCGIGSTNFDGDDFGFSLTGSNANITFSSAGSGKIAFASFSTTNAQNVIAVVATQLAFSQQPSSAGQNQAMSPSVTVTATDACGNKDLGYTGTIALTSTGTMTGAPISVAAVAGVATYTGIVHTVVGTGYTMSASVGGLTGATSSTFDIFVVTTFNGGDMAIVGMCVNQGACGGAGGEDEVSIVSFVDITPGTSFYITDNGYQRVGCGSNNWGDGEGVVQITRTTSTITAGTIITFRIMNNTVFFGVSPDNNWTIAYTVGTNFNLNNNDEQVYLMQGGTWTNGAGASDATYSGGTYMFGINTYTAWSCNDNTTTRGDLPLPLKCLSILPSTGTVNVKYTGAVTPASQSDWINRLNSISNWSASTDCPTYNGQIPNYSGGYSFSIIAGGFSSGIWTGNTSIDWFDCNNWQNFRVPDSLDNVSVSIVPTFEPTIGASPALYPNGAKCNDLLIDNATGSRTLTINNALSMLTIKGNVTVNGTISGTNGNVEFRSGVAQTFGGTGTTTLYNMWLNNTHASSLTLNQDITFSNNFYFTNGVLNINAANKLISTLTTVPSLYNYTNTKFINGKYRQYIANNTSTYPLPLGYSSASTDYHRANFLNGNITGVTYIDTYVNSITEAGNNIDSRIVATQQAEPIVDVVNLAEWNITPDAVPTGGHYGVDLYVENMGALTDDEFFVVKRDNTSTDYADWNTYDGSTFVPLATNPGRITSAGAGFATRNLFTAFSKFAIGKVSNIVLAMQVLNFSAGSKTNFTSLTWNTLDEDNVMYFEIEKSKDAINYLPIGTITSKLSSRDNNYEFIDEVPNTGITYYKLYSVNQNGTRKYHQTISVNNSDALNGYSIVYSSDAVSISLNEVNAASEVNILNTNGQLIRSFNSSQLQQGKLVLNNVEFAKGVYIIQIIQTNKVLNNKIIIY